MKKLNDKLDRLLTIVEPILVLIVKVEALEKKLQILGEQNFQLRKIVSTLAEEQAETRNDMSEYGGVIGGSSWLD